MLIWNMVISLTSKEESSQAHSPGCKVICFLKTLLNTTIGWGNIGLTNPACRKWPVEYYPTAFVFMGMQILGMKANK